VIRARYGVRVPKPLRLGFDPIDRAAETWRQRFGPSEAMAAATSVMRVQQLLLAEFDAIMRSHDLTFARYEALVLLSFSRSGALPMAKIGERLMVHPTSATNIIDRLERSGYVVREPNPRDGRGTLARITPSGRDAMERATKDLMAVDFGMSSLTDDELATLTDVLRKLRVAAEDFRTDSAEH
jgi:DNA-binding MarR family transcriptional regulator